MKKKFGAFATAIMYFSIYAATQFSFSIIFTIIVTVIYIVQLSNNGLNFEANVLLPKVTETVNANTSLILIISGIITLLIILIIFSCKKKNAFNELHIIPIKSNSILPIAMLAISFNIVLSFVMPLIPMPESWIESYLKNSSAIVNGNSFLTIIAIVITAPLVEEVIFRGLMYKSLKSGMNMAAAMIITSIAFGIVHGTIIWAVYAFIMSLVLIWLFEKFKSLCANILMHMVFNGTGLAVGILIELPDVFVGTILIIAAICLILSVYWIKTITKITTDEFDIV